MRTALNIFKKMLIPLLDVKNLGFFFWRESNPFVNYFVKTEPKRYHKIVILAQHWFADACPA